MWGFFKGFFFNPCVLTLSCLEDKSPISFSESQSFCRAVGPTAYSYGRGSQWVPLPLASSYILLFTGISLISERGQGCMILGHNLATETLGLPAHKFHILERIVKRREADMVLQRDSWPIHSILPFTMHSLVLLLLLCSLPIPHALNSLSPPAAGNGDTLHGHCMGPALPTHVPLPWEHTLGCVSTEKTDFILGCSVSTTLFCSIYY